MVRGRGYSRGRGGGSSYRGSSSSYRSSSGRNSSSGFDPNYNSRSYGSNYENYASRNRERMSSRRSDKHDDHKRSYSASSRDRSPDRKRSRHEDSRMSSSYSSYRRTDSRSHQTPPPPSNRMSSSYRHRDDSSSHRRTPTNNESMGPPKNLPPRSTRMIRSRGASSSYIRGRPTRGIRIIRHRESRDMSIMRRKLLLAHQRDRARKIKIAKLTSSLRKRSDSSRKSSHKLKKTDDEDDIKNEDNTTKKIKVESEEENWEEKGEETDSKDKTRKKRDESDIETIGDKEDEDKENDDAKSKSTLNTRRRPKFIKLSCTHCHISCLTFKDYNSHLYSRVHQMTMRKLAMRQKAQLSRMRLQQRNNQRDIEENSKEETANAKPQFCLLCRLNYRQPKAIHQASDAHRNMKKFLMPYCRICHIAFKSPMVYETHRCSLEHIRLKARNFETAQSEGSSDEKEVDLKNFLTVDSVGEIDGNEDDDKNDEETKEKVSVGSEHVKKTEAYFCDLCSFYFAVKDNEEDNTIKKHCISRSHLKAYLRYKKDQNLRQEAERVQRSQKDTKIKKRDSNIKSENAENGEVNDENEETAEEQSWEDVDKDLGDLLNEDGQDDGHDDDEEYESVLDINIGRYDRFTNTDKAKKEVNGDAVENNNENNDDIENEPKPTVKVNDNSTSNKVKKDIETKPILNNITEMES